MFLSGSEKSDSKCFVEENFGFGNLVSLGAYVCVCVWGGVNSPDAL